MNRSKIPDLSALKATVEAVERNPRTAQVTFSVVGEWAGEFRLDSTTGAFRQGEEIDESRVGRFSMSSDEPTSLLGTDTAVSPGEYIAQALAGCYAVTLAANAAVRGIEVRSLALEVEVDFDLRRFLGMESDTPVGASEVRVLVTLDAPGHDPSELHELIAAVEQRSPVRDTLARPVPVVTALKIA
ncbi:Uncharacterized OsmC-related protein [Streptosporangium subroseum]|uniref:Uncharacterized OsmC-related protein n=2 Tax=Streptosporangium subroseum TaxID=106412 RepID=A0A239PDD7_9ACTN|nr:Uncharacterized OsmC-related protein [Streptosporangium subroseum]